MERRRQLLAAALRNRPGDVGLLMTLGWSYPLNRADGADERLRWYQAAIAAAPSMPSAQNLLGAALRDKGDLAGAVAAFRKAIELDPTMTAHHNNLGSALADKGQVDEAIACWRKAIALDPTNARAHTNLGIALYVKGQVDEAIACHQKAIALDPKNAIAHTALGCALYVKGQVDEAIACYHKAIALGPKYANAHLNLGLALQRKGQVDEAIACYHKAIELEPKLAPARANLAKSERLAATRDKFAAFQKGSYTPASNAERLVLAEWCQIKKLHHAATRLYAAAFAADPKLADDLRAGHRYNAACYAALAAAGQGEDAAKLDAKEHTRLRKQALDWLRADLVSRQSSIDG
jgi:tetratricopeptide (TPR) repeat protein